ncbi:predicted protein [Histoplasma mississippiense (nom. inval.)]|uniref:predicted protein n=1 Tax=Ajellomyces capsulatus (strain NAm1 / WU24) TaxID=2059318 RepID=UPI000157CB17|nr:predicted protein [Histoplasma mississippiense (nom. inval.)]EDN09150.1 predicted protein [Histoplasma mississippiense (nom. inval.)]
MGGRHGVLVSGCSLQALKHGAAANNTRGRSLKIELMQQRHPFHGCRMRITAGGGGGQEDATMTPAGSAVRIPLSCFRSVDTRWRSADSILAGKHLSTSGQGRRSSRSSTMFRSLGHATRQSTFKQLRKELQTLVELQRQEMGAKGCGGTFHRRYRGNVKPLCSRFFWLLWPSFASPGLCIAEEVVARAVGARHINFSAATGGVNLPMIQNVSVIVRLRISIPAVKPLSGSLVMVGGVAGHRQGRFRIWINGLWACEIITLLDRPAKVTSAPGCVVGKDHWVNGDVVLEIREPEEIFQATI